MAFAAWICFAVAGLSLVNADCGKASTTSTITSASDASALSSCTVFSGSLAIATHAAGDIEIPGIQEILGDLVMKTVSNVTSLSLGDLRRLDGTFLIDNAQIINTLSFPKLTEVGSISFSGLANLEDFQFTAGITTVSEVDIQNTLLSSLTGLNIFNASVLNIVNNRFLQQIDLPVENLQGSLTVQLNGDRCSLTLANLTTAGNVTVANVPELAVPSMAYVTGGLYVSGLNMSEIVFHSLKIVQSDMIIQQSSGSETFMAAALLQVGGQLEIGGNFTSVDLEQLTEVAGFVNITGPLQSLSMNALNTVGGALLINSTDPSFDCSPFDQYKTDNTVRGYYSCIGEHGVASTTPTAGSDSGTGSSSSSSSSGTVSQTGPTSPAGSPGPRHLTGGAIGGIVAGVVVGLAALAIGAYLIWRRRKLSGATDDVTGQEVDTAGEIAAEKDGVPHIKELPTGDERHEVAAHHGVSETAGQPMYELPDNTQLNGTAGDAT